MVTMPKTIVAFMTEPADRFAGEHETSNVNLHA